MTSNARFLRLLFGFSLYTLLLTLASSLLIAPASQAARRRTGPGHEAIGHLTFTSPQSNPIALSSDGDFLFVANTTSNSVDVIDATINRRVRQINVGLEPVSVAVRPDGKEVWVANHVSDSVSVIDTDPASASYLRVVETVQALRADGATLFDEPVGIAFASDSKAYVALSSRNQIAVVDAASYTVTGTLNIRAQEPRAIAVRNGRLYVAAFESGNQSELSGCVFSGPSPQCTLFIQDLATFATDPNMPGFDKNIVIDPLVPDRDLFVFDTTTDTEIKVVEGVGTLLYGLAVDANDRVYVTQTDARNAVNGITSGPWPGDVNEDGDVNLRDLQNRMFDNQVAIYDCGVAGPTCAEISTVGLDSPIPSSNPGDDPRHTLRDRAQRRVGARPSSRRRRRPAGSSPWTRRAISSPSWTWGRFRAAWRCARIRTRGRRRRPSCSTRSATASWSWTSRTRRAWIPPRS